MVANVAEVSLVSSKDNVPFAIRIKLGWTIKGPSGTVMMSQEKKGVLQYL